MPIFVIVVMTGYTGFRHFSFERIQDEYIYTQTYAYAEK